MNTRGVIGQKIVKITHARQGGASDHSRAAFVYVDYIYLENGTVLRTWAHEVQDGPVGDLLKMPWRSTKEYIERTRKDKKQDDVLQH